jgi:hypothetical protein
MTASLTTATLLDRLTAVPLTYWFLWSGSLAASIGLLLLLRTQWGQSRPLQKCAVLSLLVHALLACLAMTVRVVVGEGGGGAGAPIRVRIVADSEGGPAFAGIVDESAAEKSAPPTLVEPPQPEQMVASDATANSEEQAIAPPLLDSPPTDADNSSAQIPAVSEELMPNDDFEVGVTTIVGTDETVPPSPEEESSNDESAEAISTSDANTVDDLVGSATPFKSQHAPTTGSQPATAISPHATGEGAPASPAPGAPTDGAYSRRNSSGRLGLVELQGGNAQTEAAVVAALAWLDRAQSPDGRWDANRFGAGQEQAVLGHHRGGAGRNADTGISALALLAFLGAGHSHQQGDYQDTVRRGLEFLLRSQVADGSLFGDATLYAQMYCHSMATFALAEAQAMTGDRRLQSVVTKAVDFCLRAQHPTTGGWRYRPSIDTGDTSQLGWQMMALASAQRAGVEVPVHTWSRMGRFLRSVRRGKYGGLASYRPDSPASTSMTAEALYCRLLLHEVGDENIDGQADSEATTQLLAALPDAKRVNLYYWYYATLALHHRHQSSEQAATAWRAWNEALTTVLLETQLPDGPNAGSWDTNTVWGGYGGRVYTTAMATMCLEVYYRYAPTQSGAWMATRAAPEDTAR